jgi:uncharacterized membrane protein
MTTTTLSLLMMRANFDYRGIGFGYLATWALPVWISWNPLLPYFTAVVLLAIGLPKAIRNAPSQLNVLAKIILCGPVFVGVPMVVFGEEHYLLPAEIGGFIPAWIPAHTFWLYFVGTCLILGGLSIVARKYAALSAGLFGVMLLCFELLMDIPAVVATPHDRLTLSLMFREFSFSAGALAFAAMWTQQWKAKGTHWLTFAARMVIGTVLIFFAGEFFLHPELLPGVPLEQLTPRFIPAGLLWGYLTGVVFVVAGVCLLINRKACLAAAWLGVFVLFTVIVFCVPYMVQKGYGIGALNVPLDTLMFSGAILCLAGSLRGEQSHGQASQ